MAINQFNLSQGQRAERKLLISVAEWNEFEPLTSEPSDWATNYTNYYTKNGSAYTKVSDATAPTFASDTYYSGGPVREILGTRTEDSSIEYNADISTSTDIRGINYTDYNKTQPQQDLDPFLILGGSRLGAFLNNIRRRNALTELSQFTIYIISAFVGDATNGYDAEVHEGCTIAYNSIGGDVNVNFPISVYLSNNYNDTGYPGLGTVDKLSDDFTFTPDVTV